MTTLRLPRLPRIGAAVIGFLLALTLALAKPVKFDIPAQPAPAAVQAFIKQSGLQVVYDADALRTVSANAVQGEFEPLAALQQLLAGTGFTAREQGPSHFVIESTTQKPGSIEGSVQSESGRPVAGARVSLVDSNQTVLTDKGGRFNFDRAPVGEHELQITADGIHNTKVTDVIVRSDYKLTLSTIKVPAKSVGVMELDPYVVSAKKNDGVVELDPFEVEGHKVTFSAGGNIDVPRTANDPLPYQVFTDSDLVRSGATELNTFLQRNLLSSDPTTLPPEQSLTESLDRTDSANINLRGYGTDQTVVLVNGRRLPNTANGSIIGSPDVNVVPISMIERIEVLPVSSSAIYGASAIGGVINIVLKANVDATEISVGYNNALSGFDASQSSISVNHGQSLLDGKLHIHLGATWNQTTPAVEAELGYVQRERVFEENLSPSGLAADILGATPNVRSRSGSPLFGPDTPSVTSVAPGANGSGGLAAFGGREGVRNFGFFDGPGGLTNNVTYSLDRPYGQARKAGIYTGSVTWRATQWLELSLDAAFSERTVYGGHLIRGFSRRTVPEESPFNPFGQSVRVSFYDGPVALGEKYRQSKTETTTLALGALVSMPAEWKLMMDMQHSKSSGRKRSVTLDVDRLDEIIATGQYNPFRDTQVYGPPQVFYDRVVTYEIDPGADLKQGAKIGTFSTAEFSMRAVKQGFKLATGDSLLILGGNVQRRDHESGQSELRFGDGSLKSANVYNGRTSDDWGIYGELQAPLVADRWLPSAIKRIEGDIAYRYAGSSTYSQSPNPPTFGTRVIMAGGLSIRGSYSEAYRSPTPDLSVATSAIEPYITLIADPRRGNSLYEVEVLEGPNPNLVTEHGATTSLGMIWEYGKKHKLRVALDYLYTEKSNEITYFSASAAIANEHDYPDRVIRRTASTGDPFGIGEITQVRAGPINVLGRRSKNWNASIQYGMQDIVGGQLEFYGEAYYFQSYQTQLLASSPVIENIENPDATFTGWLKYRATFGARWTGRKIAFGIDGRYYHSKMLERWMWDYQGSERVKRHWEFDAFSQVDLSQWIPWNKDRYGLKAQARISNIADTRFPFAIGNAGFVQAYGDWRGRVYSLNVTATF